MTAEILGDVKVNEVRVVEDDRLDRAFHLVTLMTVRRDDVHHFCWDVVLVSHGDPREGMAEHLTKVPLDHGAICILVKLKGFSTVGQQRPCDQNVAIDGNLARKG